MTTDHHGHDGWMPCDHHERATDGTREEASDADAPADAAKQAE